MTLIELEAWTGLQWLLFGQI